MTYKLNIIFIFNIRILCEYGAPNIVTTAWFERVVVEAVTTVLWSVLCEHASRSLRLASTSRVALFNRTTFIIQSNKLYKNHEISVEKFHLFISHYFDPLQEKNLNNYTVHKISRKHYISNIVLNEPHRKKCSTRLEIICKSAISIRK